MSVFQHVGVYFCWYMCLFACLCMYVCVLSVLRLFHLFSFSSSITLSLFRFLGAVVSFCVFWCEYLSFSFHYLYLDIFSTFMCVCAFFLSVHVCLYLLVSVCGNVFIYVCVYICMYMYLCLCVCVFACMRVCFCLYVCVCMCVCVFLCLCVCVCLSMFLCVCMSLYVCVNTYKLVSLYLCI